LTKTNNLTPEKLYNKSNMRKNPTSQLEYFHSETNETATEPTQYNRKLKIGLLSTRFFSLPPIGYSGIEQVVWDLACALDKLGHEVTLFAPQGSRASTHGQLVEIGEAIQTPNINCLKAELEIYDYLREEIKNLDILHGHNWFGIEYLKKASNEKILVAHTHHNNNISWLNFYKPLFNLNLISISDWTKDVFAKQGFASCRCYNGINLDRYKFQTKKDGRFMFIGRIIKAKGPHLAIKAAREAGVGLDIIGSTTFVNDKDYVREVTKLCDGKQIKFIGEVSHETKIKYLQSARGLLIPSQFGEPFGLISVEAMACGTPPIALNDGALKEVIIDEETGFICDSIDQMVSRMKQVDFINLQACRKRAEQFSREKMAGEYVKLYLSIINGQEW
jgi:glycosyltransferase involved in cell wall biosynthesis